VDAAVVDAVEALLVAVEEFEVVGLLRGGGVGLGDAEEVVSAVGGLLDLGFEGFALGHPDAAHAPGSGGHLLNEVVFDVVGGLDGRHVGGEEVLEGLLALGREDTDAGQDAMLDGIHRGMTLAFGTLGAFGFGAVGAGGFDFPA